MKTASVISVFDGMACGILAMIEAGIQVDRYVAFEIDKYAVKTSSHNFPMIEHRGDVFHADFTEFSGFDFLVGGSPCTYWSIAQKNNRETEASGMGWELFSQYVRALHEAKPKFFIYENNKSMSKAIRASIDEAFGFEAVCINSALVSAQNRQRLYWVGKRNEDGTYSKVHVEQPEDRGILLRDVLESGFSYRGKANCLCGNRGCTSLENDLTQSRHNYSAEPVGIGYRGRMEDGKWVKRYESNGEEKANAITTAQTDSMVASPVYIGAIPDNNGTYLNGKQPSQQYRVYDPNGKAVAVTTCAITNVPERVGALPRPNGELSTSQAFRVYSVDGKSVNITAGGGGAGGKTGLYAIPVEFDGDIPIKAISSADGKTYTVYEVKDGQITIKGKSYPIKLADGFYIIRKLTVNECKRLQTVPEWYEFPVSDSQAYKMLGNGWTVSVISWLINACMAGGDCV